MRKSYWPWIGDILAEHYDVPAEDLVNFEMGVENWLKKGVTRVSIFRIWGQRIRRQRGVDRREAQRIARSILAESGIRHGANPKKPVRPKSDAKPLGSRETTPHVRSKKVPRLP